MLGWKKIVKVHSLRGAARLEGPGDTMAIHFHLKGHFLLLIMATIVLACKNPGRENQQTESIRRKSE